MNYAATIWHPHTCNSNLLSLRAIQNKALRIIPGSLTMPPIHHIHTETKILPVKEHLDMVCKQFLIGGLRPSHPSHHYVTQPSQPQAAQRFPTLQSRYLPEIQQYLTNNQTTPDEYKDIIKDIHTSTKETYRRRAPPDKVLNMAPPEIDREEDQLPRHFRTTLSQLRSVYCSRLLNYRHPVCPE